jgi:predicted SnoaL-like aldol condensation-catalyzing enzyme
MATSSTPALSRSPVDETEANRAIAIDFLVQASAGRAREVMRRYGAQDFVHHNPYFASDAERLAAAMDENARANPDKKLEVLRTIAEGSLVAVHSRVQHKQGEAPVAVVHIFRIKDGRIQELWDLAQPVPEESPNQAGMF